MVDERSYPRELDEILSQAVDRQLAEQRALRQSLEDLRDAVRELSTRPTDGAAEDMSGVEERIRSAVEVNIRGADESIRSAIHSVLGASESTFATITEQLRGLREAFLSRLDEAAGTSELIRALGRELIAVREAVLPQLQQASGTSDAVRAFGDELGSIRLAVSGVSADMEGVAQALIDFNQGLRTWADGLEDKVGSIRVTVDELRDLQAPKPEPLPDIAFAPPKLDDDSEKPEEAKPEEPSEEEGAKAESDKKKERKSKKGKEAEAPDGEVSEEGNGISERIKQTTELSLYLADQIEDLDGLMGRLTELPQQLEGTVSQALKRTLAARAKLDREAETALDDVLGALDEHVNQLSAVLERFEHEDDHLRKVALEQVELGSRLDSLQDAFLDRLERIDTDRQHNEEALAIAIDRSARGLAPRALETMAKSTKRRIPKATAAKRTIARRAAKRSAEKTSSANGGSDNARSSGRKRSPSSRKAKKGRDWTPIPEAGDETVS